MGLDGSGHLLPRVGAYGSEILLGMGGFTWAFSVDFHIEISKQDCVLAQSHPVPGEGSLREKCAVSASPE